MRRNPTIAAAAALALAALAAGGGWLAMRASAGFDAERWAAHAAHAKECRCRLPMAEDLVARGALLGLAKPEVASQLASPGEAQAACGGLEETILFPCFVGADGRVTGIRVVFDAEGRAESAEVATRTPEPPR